MYVTLLNDNEKPLFGTVDRVGAFWYDLNLII